MVCLGFEPRAAGWWAQTKPRSYGDRPILRKFILYNFFSNGALYAPLQVAYCVM